MRRLAKKCATLSHVDSTSAFSVLSGLIHIFRTLATLRAVLRDLLSSSYICLLSGSLNVSHCVCHILWKNRIITLFLENRIYTCMVAHYWHHLSDNNVLIMSTYACISKPYRRFLNFFDCVVEFVKPNRAPPWILYK